MSTKKYLRCYPDARNNRILLFGTVISADMVPDMARFYHYSHHDAKVLTPQLGDARHAAEDPRAVNKPVVWLHSMELNDTHNQRGTYEFLHIVEIDESDCQLFMDEPFDSLMKIVEKDIGVSSRPWRWYFYTGPIPIVETRKWNGTEYV